MAEPGFETRRLRSADEPLANFLEAFLRRTSIGDKTRYDYGRLLHEFDDFTDHPSLRDGLTDALATQWIETLKDRGAFAARNGAMYLKSFATWAARRGYLATATGVGVLDHFKAPPITKRVRRAYTERELIAIWKALATSPKGERNRAIALLRVLLATGIRRDAARTLPRQDVEIDPTRNRGSITVRVKSARGVTDRRIPLDVETAAALRAYLADDKRPTWVGPALEPLFLSKDGQRFTTNGFGSWMERLGEEIESATGIQWTAEAMRYTSKEESKALIHDADLREKCGAMLDTNKRHDQTIWAACKVLELRVRKIVGAPRGKSGVPLMRFAFADEPIRLRLSDDDKLQRAAAEMFTGLMSYYRNPATHEVFADLSQRGVREIVGWVDHLLTLVGQADRASTG
ncbi:MAG: TIGR02391 family protein [Chloroflexota bacterium]